VKKTLQLLGLTNLSDVHTAQLYRMDIDAESEDKAKEEATLMCEKLLANPVINIYEITILK